jgi:hypothetical protein
MFTPPVFSLVCILGEAIVNVPALKQLWLNQIAGSVSQGKEHMG